MSHKRIFTAAVDCISRFRVGKYPLKNVAQDIIKARKLNSSDRKIFLDLVFRFSREINLVHHFIGEAVRFSKGMSLQQKDMLALQILSHDGEPDADPELIKLHTHYQTWVKNVGDEGFLIALGPLLKRHFQADFGAEAAVHAKGCFDKPAKYFAIDRRHVRVEDVEAALSSQNIDYFFHKVLPHVIGTHEMIDMDKIAKTFGDHVWLMDAGSQIVAELIKPQPHERVLEMCSGEGNKAKYITMSDCHYVALEISEKRLAKAKSRLQKTNIEFILADGRNPPLPPNSFDWILLDAPCSGVGVLRRNPDLVHRLTKDDVDKYIKLQMELLNSAVKLLRPSGILIYVTCSLLRAENDQQITRLLRENSQIMPVPMAQLVGEDLRLENHALDNNCMHLYPHKEDCDGFFCAALTKKPLQ